MFTKFLRRHSPPAEKQLPRIAEMIPILCRFWLEDGVWNGSAVDLPVSVYGKTIEQAQKHLVEALIAHLEALQQVGQIAPEIKRLQHLAQSYRLDVEQMSDCELFWKTTAKISDHKVAAALCP